MRDEIRAGPIATLRVVSKQSHNQPTARIVSQQREKDDEQSVFPRRTSALIQPRMSIGGGRRRAHPKFTVGEARSERRRACWRRRGRRRRRTSSISPPTSSPRGARTWSNPPLAPSRGRSRSGHGTSASRPYPPRRPPKSTRAQRTAVCFKRRTQQRATCRRCCRLPRSPPRASPPIQRSRLHPVHAAKIPSAPS